MVWSAAGKSPAIFNGWMDGTNRNKIVNNKLGFPSGIAIDYESDQRIYWSDSKLNTIESSKQDGSNRVVVLKGDLHHPMSLDLFENEIYWTTRDSGEIFRQDKFGRGVKVRVKKDLEHSTDLKMYHDLKYNKSSKFIQY